MSPRSPTRSPACKIVFNGTTAGRRRHLAGGADLGRAGGGDEPVPARQRRPAARRPQSAAVSHRRGRAAARRSATSPSAATPSTDAGPGYDLVTGLGTPDVDNLVRNLLILQEATAMSTPDRDTSRPPGVPGLPDRCSRRRVLRAVRVPPDAAAAENGPDWLRIRDLRRRAGRAPAAAVVGQFAVPASAATVPHRRSGSALAVVLLALVAFATAADARGADHGRRAGLAAAVPALSARVRRLPRHPRAHTGCSPPRWASGSASDGCC